MKTYTHIIGALQRYAVDPDIADKAARALVNGDVVLVAITGKMGSGKDSTAPMVVQALGYEHAEHVYFAAPLKREVTEAIEFIRQNIDSTSLADDLAAFQNISVSEAQFIIKTLYDEIISGTIKTAWDRTPNTRTALQYWGTEIRRSQDEDYWVKKAIADVASILAGGDSVVFTSAYVTDARFVNEADSLRSIGASLIRLEISREAQDERIFKRDGILPSESARNHPSETSLDDYENFDLVVHSDHLSLDEVVNEIVQYITTARRTA